MAWQELVQTALRGTGQGPAAAPQGDGRLGSVLQGLEGGEPERVLLSQLAVTALWQRAGWTPAPAGGEPPAPCEAETLPVCSPAAASHLAALFTTRYRDLLPEWLGAAAAAGVRVPYRVLPALLDQGRQQRELRPAIRKVMDRRGAWLAAQNPAWSYVVGEGEDDETLWQTGSRETRQVYLERLRAEDRVRARDRIVEAWGAEGARERAAFLAALGTALGPDDEPLLEQALDDRSKEVRTVAADLLSRLPSSALVRRMIERAAPLLSIAGDSLQATLPSECTKEMLRDGIEPKPQWEDKKLGQRGWWLSQMLRTIPPSHWSESWKRPPAQLVEIAVKSDWATLLVEAWSQAALRHRDVEWAWAILNARAEKAFQAGDLSDVLPPDRLEAFVLGAIKANGGVGGKDHNHPVLGLINRCHHPWSAPFTRAVLDAFRRELETAQPHLGYQIGSTLRGLARFIPPELAGEAEQGWPTEAKAWEHASQGESEMIQTLHFRKAMLEAFRDKAG